MQYTNLIWRNGQPYSELFDDIYYSSDVDDAISNEYIAGEQEFKHVFFKNNGLPERWQTSDKFTIAELGFGSGLNFLLTVREWLKHLSETSFSETRKNRCLHYIAIEKHPLSPEEIMKLMFRYPELKLYCEELLSQYPPAVEASHSRHLFDNKVIVHFKFMDVLTALNNEYLAVDAWYLDGFSPAKNAAMWSEKLFLKLAKNCRANARLSTYTSAGFVRRNMQNAGFSVNKVKGYGKKREMLTATYMAEHEKKKEQLFKDKPWFQVDVEQVVFDKQKAVIIGAGIAGLSVAYGLVKRGWQVTIIDKHGEVAKETSSNPAAVIYPRLAVNNDVDNSFFIDAFCLSVSLMKALQTKYKKKFWFECGVLQEVDGVKGNVIITKHQFNEDFITLSKIENNKKCLCYKIAGVVLPNVLCDVLKQECGDNLNIASESVHNIKFDNNNWHCYSDNDLISSAEVLIVANGAAIKEIELPIDLSVDVVRGQIVELSENNVSRSVTNVLASKVTFSPSINGKHYLGASYSRNSRNLDVDDNETNELIESLNSAYSYNFSKLDCVDEWVGFRAMPVDRVPIVGAVPDKNYFAKEYADICHGKMNKRYQSAKYLKGLYFSLGHGSRGFTSAFLSSEIICAQIVGEPMPVGRSILEYLSPSRFLVNDLKRRGG